MKLIRLSACLLVLSQLPQIALANVCDDLLHLQAAGPRVYFLDTNVLLSEPDAFLGFKRGETVVIPEQVIREIEAKKTDSDLGVKAREFFRLLDEHTGAGALKNGVILPNGSKLEFATVSPVTEASPAAIQGLDLTPAGNPDNRILAAMIEYREKNPAADFMFLSHDNAFRILARVNEFPVGRFSEQYRTVVPVSNDELIYSGLKKHILSEQELDEFRTLGTMEVSDPSLFYDNQFVILKDQEFTLLDPYKPATPDNQRLVSEAIVARYRSADQTLNHLKVKKTTKIKTILPKNLEQRLALDLLMDPSVTMVSIFGKAGSGKTLLTMAAALEQLDKKVYEKIYYAKAHELVGGKDKLGFLKGSYDEKTGPYHESFVDNLEVIFGLNQVAALKKRLNNSPNDVLREFGMEPIKILYSRGRSITKSFIIIDEAQNLTAQELKTLGTRVGEGSKIVLMGDLGQIDLAGTRGPHMSAFLKAVNSEAFKRSEISGHIQLMEGLRSKTTDLFNDIFEEIDRGGARK